MPSIKNTFSGIGIANDIIAVLYKESAPTTEVTRALNPGPQTAPWNFIFSGLSNGTYRINIHESPDGVTLGNKRHDYWQDAATNKIVSERIFFTVGGPGEFDPAIDQEHYINTDLEGRIVTGIFQEGFRYLEPGVEVDLSNPVDIELLGTTFQIDQVWALELASLVTEAVPSGGGDFSEIIELTGNVIDLDASHVGKTLLITNTGAAQITNMPALGSLQDGDGIIIRHDGGALINVDLRPLFGSQIRFLGANVTNILLGKGEWVKAVKKGTKWFVTQEKGQWDKIGRRDGVDIIGDNMLASDGAQKDGNIYKRLYAYAVSLPPSQKTTESNWQTQTAIHNGVARFVKRGLYVVDTDAKTVRIPQMQGMITRPIVNPGGADAERADNVPGGFQGWTVGAHDHGLGTNFSLRPQSGSATQCLAANLLGSTPPKTDVHNPGGENRQDSIGVFGVIYI